MNLYDVILLHTYSGNYYYIFFALVSSDGSTMTIWLTSDNTSVGRRPTRTLFEGSRDFTCYIFPALII